MNTIPFHGKCLEKRWAHETPLSNAIVLAHPIDANTVEGVRYPFLFLLSNFGTLPNKPHKNILRMLKG
ncbi:hypothetical protein JHK87_015433 [Glycine soja]|nr:hypothetical protein JHK87_015433 [Glycine soja]